MQPQLYGIMFPNTAAVARELGCMGRSVLDVCVSVASHAKYPVPSKTCIRKNEALPYLAGLERHITGMNR